jgi:hypothetical protein
MAVTDRIRQIAIEAMRRKRGTEQEINRRKALHAKILRFGELHPADAGPSLLLK